MKRSASIYFASIYLNNYCGYKDRMSKKVMLKDGKLKYAHLNVMKFLKLAQEGGGSLIGEYVTQIIPRILAYDFSEVSLPAPRFIFPDAVRLGAFLVSLKSSSVLKAGSSNFFLLDDYGDIVCPVFFYNEASDNYEPTFRDFLQYNTVRGYHSSEESVSFLLTLERKKRRVLTLQVTTDDLNEDEKLKSTVKSSIENGYHVFIARDNNFFRVIYDEGEDICVGDIHHELS